MSIKFDELPNWCFDVDEVSAGVYKAYGSDKLGRSVEFTGADLDLLLKKCKNAAVEITKKIGSCENHQNHQDRF